MASAGALRGGAVLYVGRLLVAGLSWAGTIVIVRELSIEQWGRFAFVFSFLALVSVLTDLGVGRVVIGGLVAGEGSEDGAERARYLGTYVVLRALLGVLGYGLAVAVVAVAGYPSEVVHATVVAGVVLVLATASNALHAAFQSEDRLAPIAVAHVVAQGAQLALTIAIAVRGGSVVWFAVPAIAFEVVSLAWKLKALPAGSRPRYSIQVAVWRRVMREAAPLAVGAVVAASYTRLDSVMLSKLATFEDVAQYGIAYKFADLVHAGSTAMSVALLPAVVRAWPDRDRTAQAVQPVLAAVVAVGTLVATQFAVAAPEVVSLFYGSRYEASATAARFLVTAECLHLSIVVAYVIIIAAGRPGRYASATVAGLAVNVALNLVLIPRWSFEGAAVATLVTEATVAIILWRAVLGLGGLAFGARWRSQVLAATIGLASAGVALVLRSALPPLVAGGAVSLAALLVLYRAVYRREDRAWT